MILQCLLGEPGADCGKTPILHVIIGRDVGYRGWESLPRSLRMDPGVLCYVLKELWEGEQTTVSTLLHPWAV